MNSYPKQKSSIIISPFNFFPLYPPFQIKTELRYITFQYFLTCYLRSSVSSFTLFFSLNSLSPYKYSISVTASLPTSSSYVLGTCWPVTIISTCQNPTWPSGISVKLPFLIPSIHAFLFFELPEQFLWPYSPLTDKLLKKRAYSLLILLSLRN